MRRKADRFSQFSDYLTVCNRKGGASLLIVRRSLPLKATTFRKITRELEDLKLIEADASFIGRRERWKTERPYNFKITPKGQSFLAKYLELEQLVDPLT